MSTSKHFDKICCVVLAVVIAVSVLFVNGEKLGLTIMSKAMGYESKLFDRSYVHTINIVMDDWDSFLETCTSEEYSACSLVIDNEAYKNVAIRGKGNTSLTSVKNYGNNRYSFKVEFDAYDKTKTYYGLDKLCINNIIQDNTYMKDYLSYTMMNEFGVAAPLCSYVYLTVNGEDWGLYLAVEGVEDSFLQRNYGSDDVNLYKPDSTSMGGGRGNGEGFDMDKFNEEQENAEGNATTDNSTSEDKTTKSDTNQTEQTQNNNGMSEPPGGFGGGNMPDFDGEMPEMPEGGFDSENMPEMPEGGFSGEIPEMPDSESSDDESGGSQSAGNKKFDFSEMKDKMGGGEMGGGGMGSDDVKLIYSDDEFDSYSNIFNNAKTDIDDSDKETLISSLKNLNEETDLESTVDIEQVIRYFVVHNFVLNGDSYTGSMIHNYYLSENGGQLSMIPWDYNLAFGGFQSMGGAESLVNSPIDSPVSGGTTDSRPMLAWILNSEEYTEQYHELFSEFISSYFDSGNFAEEIDRVKEMISPYVEKDPTKFCTYDEFIKGIDTLKEFCLLRAESVTGQLNGTIGSTSETQTDTTNFVKADDITISDMGSMGNMGGGGGMDKPDSENGQQPPEQMNGEQNNEAENKDGEETAENKDDEKTTAESTEAEEKTTEKESGQNTSASDKSGQGTPPQMPNGETPGNFDPSDFDPSSFNPGGQMPGNFTPPN